MAIIKTGWQQVILARPSSKPGHVTLFRAMKMSVCPLNKSASCKKDRERIERDSFFLAGKEVGVCRMAGGPLGNLVYAQRFLYDFAEG